MGDNTGIEWTDASWTPIRARNRATGKVGWHCTHASEGCRNCYAEGRNGWIGTGLPFKPGHQKDVEIFLDEAMLLQPLRWKRPRMIFVCSMTDLFADFVHDEWIDKIFAVMALSPQHTFQVLTKRSKRMREYLTHRGSVEQAEVRNRLAWDMTISVMNLWAPEWKSEEIDGPYRSRAIAAFTKWPLPNVWLGVSAEDQPRADERIPDLLATPAAVRFVSAEPLLGPLDLYNGDPDPRLGGHRATRTYLGDWWEPGDARGAPARHGLDWIIAGGESGPHARPMHPDWVRSLRDQCAAADVPFFFKQWGEWSPDTGPLQSGSDPIVEGRARCAVWHGDRWTIHDSGFHPPIDAGVGPWLYRLSKRAAGRLLDGREHNDMPGRS